MLIISKCAPGEFYFNRGYYEDGGLKIKQDQFLAFANEIFRQFKRQLIIIKEARFNGHYFSASVSARLSKQEIGLIV